VSSAEIHREVLPGGPRVLLREARLAPVVELQIWCRAGSADERAGESGLAHFHEHMLFKGTQRRGVGAIAADVEGAGGRINAYTSFDVTVYHATLPSDRLEVGIDVLCDAVLHSVFDPQEIAREIEVVLEEIRRGEDSPFQVLGNAVFARAFEVHPYRSPILGTPESVAAFDQARVRAFFERWYAPDQLTVVAAGDFDRGVLLARLREAFAGAGPSLAKRERAPEPPQRGLRSVVLARGFERASLELAWRGVELAHPDAALLDLLAFVLGCGESSRLVRRVKERDALADRLDASCFTPLDPGLFSVDVETDPERAADAIAAVAREVEILRREPVSDEELEKARANFLANEHFARESVSGLAQKLGGFELLAGDWRAEQRYLESVRRATPAELLRVARAHLAAESLTVGAVLPEAEAGALGEARIAAAVAEGSRRIARVFATPSSLPASGPALGYGLGSGARLYVIPRRDVPVVAARAAFFGGQLAEDAGTAGLSSFLAAMWLRGTAQRSAADFARATESLAAEIDGFAGRSSLGLTLEAPREGFAAAFDLFAEALLEPAFAAAELERERIETLAAIERREDRLAQRAYLLFAETHFRSHPYRLPLLGTAASVSAFGAEGLRAHHQRLVRARNLVVAVAGDVDPDDAAIRIASRLADLDGGGFQPPTPPDEEAPREIRRASLRKQRAQSHLVIGFRGLSVHDPDRFALDLVTQLLSGQGGRLFLELRDRRSLAYAVNANNLEGFAPGTFTVYVATAPEKRAEAEACLLAELAALLERAPDPAELERAQRFLVGSFAIDRQRNAVHAAHTALDALYGLGPDAADRYPERILSLTPEDVLRVARRVIRLDAYTLAEISPG
jgi:zinc protease